MIKIAINEINVIVDFIQTPLKKCYAMVTKTFECTLVHKRSKHIKVDFIKADDAVKASVAIQKFNPDWICKSADEINNN